MDRVHFDDLTKINVPFGLLDNDTQHRLLQSHKTHAGIEYFYGGDWWPAQMVKDRSGNENHCWQVVPSLTYRAKPAPLTKPNIPDDVWRVMPDWVAGVSGSGSFVYAHSSDAMKTGQCWRSTFLLEVTDFKGVTPGTCDWKDSWVPKPEGL